MARRDPDQLTALRRTRYLGSHPSLSGQISDVVITFTATGIRFRKRRHEIHELSWGSIVELDASEDERIEYLNSRRSVWSYLVITDRTGRWVFEVPDLSRIELESGLVPLKKFIPPQDTLRASSWNPGPHRSFADRMEQLHEMHNRGHISSEEFEAKRTQLLDEL